MSSMPETEIVRLKALAEDIGAMYDSAAGEWTLPYYMGSASHIKQKMLPVDEWLRARQVAAIAVEKMLRERDDTKQGEDLFVEEDQAFQRRAARTGDDRRYGDRRIQTRRIEDVAEQEPALGIPARDSILAREKIHSVQDVREVLDRWKHRSAGMKCQTCMFYVPKVAVLQTDVQVGRCRESSPTIKGWPAVYPSDWCGAHKLDADRL